VAGAAPPIGHKRREAGTLHESRAARHAQSAAAQTDLVHRRIALQPKIRYQLTKRAHL
jgi:hypothetical protein